MLLSHQQMALDHSDDPPALDDSSILISQHMFIQSVYSIHLNERADPSADISMISVNEALSGQRMTSQSTVRLYQCAGATGRVPIGRRVPVCALIG